MSVRRARSEPSAFIAYISLLPSLLDTNAMRPLSAVGVGVCAETGDPSAQNEMAATAIASAARRWNLPDIFPFIQLPRMM